MRKKRYTAMRLLLVAALLTTLLSGCSFMKKFKASPEMTSSIELYKHVDGLERIDDKYKAEFVETINKKYNTEAINDFRLNAVMPMSMTAVMVDYGNAEMQMDAEFNIVYQYSKPDNLGQMNMDASISLLGMSVPMNAEMFMDFANNKSYTNMTAMGQSSGWTKSALESDSTDKLKDTVLFTEDKIEGIYQDPESKAYAVVSIEESETDLLETGMKVDSMKLITTFDEGLAVAGLYCDMKDSIDTSEYENGQYKVNTLDLTVKPEAINDGSTVTLPEEAANAVEKSDGTDISDIFGGAMGAETAPEVIPEVTPEAAPEATTDDTAEDQTAAESTEETKEVAEMEDATPEDTSDSEESAAVPSQFESYADAPLVINGQQVTLGDITLSEFLSTTGLTLNEEDAGKSVDPGNEEYVLIETDSYDYSLSLSVENSLGTEALNVKDCKAYSVMIMYFSDNPSSDLISLGGIKVGSSLDDVTSVFGTPFDTYKAEDSSYTSFTYADDNAYMSFTASNGETVDSISYSNYTYYSY